MQCPKCHAQMQTYNRNGIQIEQCSGCRGIFLDYGELESLTRVEAQWTQQAPLGAARPAGLPGGPGTRLGRPAASRWTPPGPLPAEELRPDAVLVLTRHSRPRGPHGMRPGRGDGLRDNGEAPVVETTGASDGARYWD